ncbi:hypothetical protein Rhal01_03463 [Rubritalea halochordaticola]|uniref:Uncharacterized protein n=1 Tax=Rubritalea halochordaticola TaxID=714537 RepID=A0ABP9V5L1_9BACT
MKFRFLKIMCIQLRLYPWSRLTFWRRGIEMLSVTVLHLWLVGTAQCGELSKESVHTRYSFSKHRHILASVVLHQLLSVSESSYEATVSFYLAELPDFNEEKALVLLADISKELVDKHDIKKLKIMFITQDFDVFSNSIKVLASKRLKPNVVHEGDQLTSFLSEYANSLKSGRSFIETFDPKGFKVSATAGDMKIRVSPAGKASIKAGCFGFVLERK